MIFHNHGDNDQEIMLSIDNAKAHLVHHVEVSIWLNIRLPYHVVNVRNCSVAIYSSLSHLCNQFVINLCIYVVLNGGTLSRN